MTTPGNGAQEKTPAAPPANGIEFLATALRKRVKAVLREIPGIRKGQDMECLHDIRVAARRLRSALSLLADFFPERTTRHWRKPVRRLTRALGAARDSDVQIAFIQSFLKTLSAPMQKSYRSGIRRLLLRLTQQREALQSKVLRELACFEKAGIAGDLNKALHRKKVHALPLQRLYAVAFKRLTDLVEAMLAYETQVLDPERVAELHAMRIAARRLRYAMEVFAPLYAGQLKAAHDLLTGIQELLGDIHDCDVWIEFLPSFLEAERSRARTYCGRTSAVNRLNPGLEHLARERRCHREQRYREFIVRWETIRKQHFWKSFCHILQPPPGNRRRPKPAAGTKMKA